MTTHRLTWVAAAACALIAAGCGGASEPTAPTPDASVPASERPDDTGRVAIFAAEVVDYVNSRAAGTCTESEVNSQQYELCVMMNYLAFSAMRTEMDPLPTSLEKTRILSATGDWIDTYTLWEQRGCALPTDDQDCLALAGELDEGADGLYELLSEISAV